MTATGVVGGAARALCTPTGLMGAAVEATWLATHVALYPWGLVADRRQGEAHGYSVSELPPVQRGLVIGDVEAAGTPILLVHGMADNRSIFSVLRLGLRRRGFGRVLSMNYSPFTTDVRGAAARLAEEVELLVAETGYERIHVVGHSLGGLIARYYVTRLGGDQRVHTLVTLGTPHQGTYTAFAWPSRLTRQLRPGSTLMRELAEPVSHCRTRFVVALSHPVRRLLVGPRPDDLPAAARQPAPRGPVRPQRAAARRRAHEPADPRQRGPRHLHGAGAPGPRRLDRHGRRDAPGLLGADPGRRRRGPQPGA
ncbi:MAG: esterase/lipase family protein [Oryzihumus sp.]